MRRAIFYEFPDADPNTDRFVHEHENGSVTIVLVGRVSMVPAVAREMADSGVELVELCGGMPVAVRAAVKAAVSDRTRVASVAFGIESIAKAAEFNQSFLDGKPPPEAGVVLVRGADPNTDRFSRNAGLQSATFILADELTVSDVVRQLADQGVGLIELYGEFSDDTVSEIIDAVAGRSAVGVSGFGHR